MATLIAWTIACVSLSAAWLYRVQAEMAAAQLAQARAALKPFADLVLDTHPDEAVPATAAVHCLILGEGPLGDLDTADFHRAARAIQGEH